LTKENLHNLVDEYRYAIQVALDCWSFSNYEITKVFEPAFEEWQDFIDLEAMYLIDNTHYKPRSHTSYCSCYTCYLAAYEPKSYNSAELDEFDHMSWKPDDAKPKMGKRLSSARILIRVAKEEFYYGFILS